MGWLERRRERKAAEAAQRAAAAVEHQHDIVRAVLANLDGRGDALSAPIQLKKGERVLWVLDSCELFESRSPGGHWAGRSSGVSVPTGIGGIRLRVGQSHGHYVHDPEQPTVIDNGRAVITTLRVVFLGQTRSMEWAYAKLLAFTHFTNRPATAIQVSNRQKVSGVIYGTAEATPARLAMEVGAAEARGEGDSARQELNELLAAKS